MLVAAPHLGSGTCFYSHSMSRGRHGKGAAPNIAQRLNDLEDRVESLDVGLQEVHPEYANRILGRMHELENLTRQHANNVFQVLTNQRDACHDIVKECKDLVSQAAIDADAACKRLDDAADRHQKDGAAVRSELGSLKEMIDTQSLQCTSDLDKMERLVQQASDCLQMQEALSAQAEEQLGRLSRMQRKVETVVSKVSTIDFKKEQEKVVRAARSASASLPEIIVRAQGVARSREPSHEPSADAGGRDSQGRRHRSFSRGRPVSISDAAISAAASRARAEDRQAAQAENVLAALMEPSS